MSKGLAILVAVILGSIVLGWFFFAAVRQTGDATSVTSPGSTTAIPPAEGEPSTDATGEIRTDIFSQDVLNKINARDINGQLPVTVDFGLDFGRDDPFAPF